MRVLLVRLSAIGDVVHTLPAAAALRGAGHEVGWLVEPAARSLVEGSPAVRHVHLAPAARRFSTRAAWAVRAELRAARYDVALELQGLWKSAAWARLSGAARVVGYGRRFRREPASALLLGERQALPDGLPHVIDKNLALLQALGVSAVGGREFPLPPLDESAARIERFVAAAALTFPVLLDRDGAVTRAWTRRIFPTSVLVGPDGRARQVIVGEFDWNGPQAGSLIAALLPR